MQGYNGGLEPGQTIKLEHGIGESLIIVCECASVRVCASMCGVCECASVRVCECEVCGSACSLLYLRLCMCASMYVRVGMHVNLCI